MHACLECPKREQKNLWEDKHREKENQFTRVLHLPIFHKSPKKCRNCLRNLRSGNIHYITYRSNGATINRTSFAPIWNTHSFKIQLFLLKELNSNTFHIWKETREWRCLGSLKNFGTHVLSVVQNTEGNTQRLLYILWHK